MMKTKRIVIDTNVIVSALIFHNSPTMEAFRKAKEQGMILISAKILQEKLS